MPTKITFVYDHPDDPAVFEAAYPELIALARTIPGLLRLETAKVWPKEDGSLTPAYRLLDLYFPDYDTASEAVTTPPARSFFPGIFQLATGGVRVVFADIE
jgi:uncharacterized protein (TIGR02118 family)